MMRHTTAMLAVIALLLSACIAPTPNMANPASVNCREKGGRLETRDEEGGQVGYCIFEDGSECEEWTFYRGECVPGVKPANMANPASAYCVENGGTLEIRDEEGAQIGYCIFEDRSECEEWAFMRGTCAPGNMPVGMPNPASVYCEEQGGKLDIRDEDGGQVGYCIFNDGSECDEWAFFRSECGPGGKPVGLANPASVYCEENGGNLQIREEEGGQAGYCSFSNGSECEEWAYFRGECGPAK